MNRNPRPRNAGPERVTVLVAAYHRTPFWNLPPEHRTRLEQAFPGVEWVHEPRWEDGFGSGLERAAVFFGWHLSEASLDRATRLCWIQSPATGVRRLLYPSMITSPVRITSARGVHAPFMAEHVMAWILGHTRRLPIMAQAQSHRHWSQSELLREGSPDTVSGKTLLIVGFGATGRALAARAQPFGMRVVAIRRRPGDQVAGVDAIAGPEAVDDLLPGADFVVNALPNTEETRGFFSRERLARLSPRAMFINVGRGSTVDEEALAESLQQDRLGAVALDVFEREPLSSESPLWGHPRSYLSPHVAGVGGMALWQGLVDLFSDNLSRFLAGQPLRNLVDKSAGY